MEARRAAEMADTMLRNGRDPAAVAEAMKAEGHGEWWTPDPRSAEQKQWDDANRIPRHTEPVAYQYAFPNGINKETIGDLARFDSDLRDMASSLIFGINEGSQFIRNVATAAATAATGDQAVKTEAQLRGAFGDRYDEVVRTVNSFVDRQLADHPNAAFRQALKPGGVLANAVTTAQLFYRAQHLASWKSGRPTKS
jgi:hypothetical protein